MFNATSIKIPSNFKHKRPIYVPTHSPILPTHLSTYYLFSHSDIYLPLIHSSATHSHTNPPIHTVYSLTRFAVLELVFLMFQRRTCRDGCVTDTWLCGPRSRTFCLLCPCVSGAEVSFRNPEGLRTVTSWGVLWLPWWESLASHFG